MTSEHTNHINGLTPGSLALLKDIAEAAADKSAVRILTAMGIDADNPIASQELFTALRALVMRANDPEASADREFTRRVRLRSEGTFGKVVTAAAILMMTGAIHTLWIGIKSLMTTASTP